MKFLLLISAVVFLQSCASWRSGRTCEISQRKINDDNFSVMLSVYSDITPAQKTLLILPPTGGTNLIDRSYAKSFCDAGYDVYIISDWTGLFETAIDLDLHQRVYTRAQHAIGMTLAEVKSPFIGLLGTSLGALHASIAACLQDRLNAVFTIVGGAPITEVIVTSDQQAMIELREARKKKYGFRDAHENQLALEKAFHLEPMQLGTGFRKKHLGMSVATEDSTVPYASQKKLEDFWQPEKIIEIPTGHFWGIVRTWFFDKAEVIDFFEKSANKL